MITAGVVPFYKEDRYIIDKIKMYYEDCLPQCFYALRYTNYKNSILLQKISHKNGIQMNDVIKILDLAFPQTYFNWKPLIYSPKVTYTIVKNNEATLLFLEKENGLGHYVVMYRKDNELMILDPQENARAVSNTLINYKFRTYFHTQDVRIYVLTDNEHQHTPFDGVKREHICKVFNCESYEEKDRLKRKKFKVYTKKLKKYNEKISKCMRQKEIPKMVEPIYNSNNASNVSYVYNSTNSYNSNDSSAWSRV
jgi:hypothetical protein